MSTATVDPPAAAANRGGEFLRRYGVVVVWAVMILVFSMLRPETFPTWGNFTTIAGSQAVLVIITMALLFPLAAGEFDLSVSGVLGVSLVLVGWLNVEQSWAIVPTVIVALGAGLLVGLVNAFFVVVARVESIVVTLGTGTLLAGLALAINDQTVGGVSSSLVDAVRTPVLGIPVLFFYGVLLTVGLWYVFSYTPFGRYLYFVGANPDVARLAGVKVAKVRVASFLLSGLLSALAGVVLAGSLGAADPNTSTTYLLPAFAAAFLGSSMIAPGRFNPWGALIAVYFLITGITGLQLLGLSGWIEQVFYGGSLVLAVAFARLAARRVTD
jgi:ribose transport system permease protein